MVMKSSQDPGVEVSRILGMALGELVAEAGSSVRPPLHARSWNLPDGGLDALFGYGLPAPISYTYMSIEAVYQDSPVPAYADETGEYYLLGKIGAVLLGARGGDGAVFAIPEVREVIPALRDKYPAGIENSLANSSIEALVELGWRWSLLSVVLAAERGRALVAEDAAWKMARAAGRPHYPGDSSKGYAALCARVGEAFAVIDPVSVDADDRLWAQLLER